MTIRDGRDTAAGSDLFITHSGGSHVTGPGVEDVSAGPANALASPVETFLA
jgi:hypothetical protein